MDDLLFIHIPKTAGSSITAVLGQPRDHSTAAKYIEQLGPHEWRRRLTFAVVRHPFDRFVSAWSFLLGAQPGCEGWVHARQSREAMLRHGSMENFIRAGAPAMFEIEAFRPQVEWLSPMPRLLLRFEALDEQFQAHFGRQLPHYNASVRSPWQEVLLPSHRAMLSRLYAADFTQLGYQTEN